MALHEHVSLEAGLLLLLPLLWLEASRRLRALDSTRLALLAHLFESALVLALLPAADSFGHAVWALVLLAGPAALGGLRFLWPNALLLVALLALAPPQVASPDPAVVLHGALLFSFTLALALVGHAQAQRLHASSLAARSQAETLDLANARLKRYLPEPLRVAAPLPARAPPDQRWVTVAFVDLVGFTALVRKRAVAEIVELVDDYHCTLDDLARDHDAVLGKFLGDGVLVYYPETASRSEDAARCLALVLALPEHLSNLADRWRSRGQLLELEFRAGVASGYCAVGDWGGEGRLDHTVIGDAVNLASRLQEAAPAGGALLAASTAALLEADASAAARLDEPQRLVLKGMGEVVAFGIAPRPAPLTRSGALSKVPAPWTKSF